MCEIYCSCCGLFLGEAEQAVEMVCPLCVEVRAYAEYVTNGSDCFQNQWDLAVFEKSRETNDMIVGMLEKRSIAGAIE